MLCKLATPFYSDEKRKDGRVVEVFQSFQSDKVVKNRKATRVVQINYIKGDDGEYFQDGFIYQEELEKLAAKFSIDFRTIIDKGF